MWWWCQAIVVLFLLVLPPVSAARVAVAGGFAASVSKKLTFIADGGVALAATSGGGRAALLLPPNLSVKDTVGFLVLSLSVRRTSEVIDAAGAAAPTLTPSTFLGCRGATAVVDEKDGAAADLSKNENDICGVVAAVVCTDGVGAIITAGAVVCGGAVCCCCCCCCICCS